MFALRAVPHESTEFSSAERVHGRELRLPLRMLQDNWTREQQERTVVECELQLLKRMSIAREMAQACMSAAQAKSKLYYDRPA